MNTNLIELLKKVGFNRTQAQALDFLVHNKEWPVQARDIEKGADLRQPEANTVIRSFVERQWLDEKKAPRSGSKGKPSFLYKFRLSRKDLYQVIENNIQSKIAELNGILNDDLRKTVMEE